MNRLFGCDVFAWDERTTERVVLCLGFFDCLHKGHVKVIGRARDAAKSMGAKVAAFTFDGDPHAALGRCRKPVFTFEERVYRMSYFGVDEIFVGDGAKSDLGNMVELFAKSRVLLPDPVYPAYRDVNVMAGNRLYFAAGGRRNGFKPAPPEKGEFDIIYICSPNNPTGAVYDREELKAWVDYARATGAVIFFDAAYEAFVSDPALPTSIFEIEGARECAVEFCSFSKSAGFTGMRCGWTVVPRELAGGELNKMWLRRQTTKFNGVSYVVQRAAAAALGKQGRYENKKSVDYYMQNARVIHEALTDAGIWHTGGVDSPYIWMRCPRGMSSWDYFDLLLERAAVVGTPGVGFGRRGEGYFRLTAFGNAQKTARAAARLAEVTLTLAR